MNDVKCPSCGGKTSLTRLSGYGDTHRIYNCDGNCCCDIQSASSKNTVREPLTFAIRLDGSLLFLADRICDGLVTDMPRIFQLT